MKYLSGLPRKNRGLAAVEMTLVAPILLILGIGAFELTHVFQAKNISIALAREGANLVSRSIVSSDQEVMNALTLSAEPLDFSQHGIIYISVVVGDDEPEPYVSEQHRWLNYGFSSESKIWDECSSWGNDGACFLPSSKPRLADFPMTLESGETVHVVEVFYDYSWFTNIIFDQNLLIYSRTLM